MFKRLAFIEKDQSGFTLVELIIAVAITSLITVGLVMTILQLWGGHARASGEMIVVRQVQNAGYWISRDAQMAQEVDPDPELDASPGFPLTLTWYQYAYNPDNPDRRGIGYRVIYTLVDGKLERGYYRADDQEEEGETPDEDFIFQYTTFIAEYISSPISCLFDGEKLTLTVTASIGGWKPQIETRTYETMPRPDTMY